MQTGILQTNCGEKWNCIIEKGSNSVVGKRKCSALPKFEQLNAVIRAEAMPLKD